MSRKGAKSRTGVPGLRSNRTKASTDVDRLRACNADLEKKLAEALEHQAAASEVLNVISRSPANAQPVFDAIVQSAARLCGAVFSIVYLYDGGCLRIAATNKFTNAAMSQIQELKRPDRSQLGGRAILDRKIIHVHDVLADAEYSRKLALAGGWRAGLSVPMLHDGKPVGAISVAKSEPVPFSERQIHLLKTFADQAVIAIENVRLFEAEQQRTRELSEALEQQTATSEVLSVISGSPGELEPVFQSMLTNATGICEANFGVLFLYEEGAFRAGALHGAAPPSFVETRRRNPIMQPVPGTALGRLAAAKQTVQVADVRIPPHAAGSVARRHSWAPSWLYQLGSIPRQSPTPGGEPDQLRSSPGTSPRGSLSTAGLVGLVCGICGRRLGVRYTGNGGLYPIYQWRPRPIQ